MTRKARRYLDHIRHKYGLWRMVVYHFGFCGCTTKAAIKRVLPEVLKMQRVAEYVAAEADKQQFVFIEQPIVPDYPRFAFDPLRVCFDWANTVIHDHRFLIDFTT